MNGADPLRVALLEPFFKGSHKAWAEGWRRHSRHRVRLETLPGVHWKWRMSHSAPTFAARLAAGGERPDVLLCTSMVDGAALRGLLPRELAGLPLAVMFHENQLTYPLPAGEARDLNYAWTHVTTALAADRVLFNSAFHRRDFLAALDPFLRGFPDHAPLEVIERLRERSAVVWPGVERERFLAAGRAARRTGPLRILWSHRWEPDKDPQGFLAAVEALGDAPCTVVLAGAGADDPPPDLAARIARLGRRVERCGWVPAEEYAAVVAGCDLAVSTARHDFYGIGVVEAMTAGLCPLLPRRQNYPDLVPPGRHADCLYDDADDLVRKLRRHVEDPDTTRRIGAELPPALAGHDLRRTAAALDDRLSALAAAPGGPGAAG